MKIILTKLAGETGLRRPGTLIEVSKVTGESWVRMGLAKKFSQKKIRPKTQKEEKTNFETKEEKQTPKTKKNVPKSD